MFESKTMFRKQEWNGGSKKGGYDEYWLPLVAANKPEEIGPFARRLTVTFRQGKVVVAIWTGSLGAQHGISFPRVNTMYKIIELAKLARLPYAEETQ